MKEIPIGTIVGPLTEETKMPVLRIFSAQGLHWGKFHHQETIADRYVLLCEDGWVRAYSNLAERDQPITPEAFLSQYSQAPPTSNPFDGMDELLTVQDFLKTWDFSGESQKLIAADLLLKFIRFVKTPKFSLTTEGETITNPEHPVWTADTDYDSEGTKRITIYPISAKKWKDKWGHIEAAICFLTPEAVLAHKLLEK